MMVGKRNVNETKGRSIRWGAVLVGVALASLSPSTAFAEDVIPNPGADLDPPSQWLVRRNLSIPANPISNASFDAGLIPKGTADAPDEGQLDELEGCDMDNVDDTWHPFVTDTIRILKAGIYTFRIVASPGVDDPFLALYEGSFNPAEPNTGVIGCNDDGVEGDVFDENPWDPTYEYGPNDDEEYWSQFTTDTLQPGTYTIMMATYDSYSDNTAWYNDGNGDNEAGGVSISALSGPATAVFEYWGPEGGIALESEGGRPSFDKDAYFDWQNGRAGDVSGSELPNTGSSSNAVNALIALGLVGVGSTFVTVARRRRIN